MSLTSTLHIQILDVKNELIALPKIQLLPFGSKQKKSVAKFKYDSETMSWVAKKIPYGYYNLFISAKGFGDQKMKIELFNDEVFLTENMSIEGLPYIIQQGKRVYYEENKEQIGILLNPSVKKEVVADRNGLESLKLERKPNIKISAAFDRISKRKIIPVGLKLTNESRFTERTSNLFTLDVSKLKNVQSKTKVLKDLVDSDEVLFHGELISSFNQKNVILTSEFEILTDHSLDKESLSKILKKYGLKIDYQSFRSSNFFQASTNQSIDKGELAEKLVAEVGIVFVNSVTISEIKSLSVFPSDVNSPLQFYHFLTRLPEAWEQINPAANSQLSYGSADIIIAVNDRGIRTVAPGFTIHQNEFNVNVNGGVVSNLPGVNSAKVAALYNFSPSPMTAGNGVALWHGTAVAGTISAAKNGNSGVVGVAANTRLRSYARALSAGAKFADCLEYIGGIDPQWRQGINHHAADIFPNSTNTGKNPIPYNSIINCSHTYPAIGTNMRDALDLISHYGRNHKGNLTFVAAGNNDANTRTVSGWNQEHNVLKVAASSVDVTGNEVRMNYSCFSILLDKTIDFVTPSNSDNVSNPMQHIPPHTFGFPITHLNNAGGPGGTMKTGKGTVANLMNSPIVGSRDILVSLADYALFANADQVIISNTNNLFYSEFHIVDRIAPNILRTRRNLGYDYTLGSSTITQLTGTTGSREFFGGTSAATPQAAGIAALLLSANPKLTWIEVRELMRRTALPINLRYRGTIHPPGPTAAANLFRYRWLTSANVNLILANGLLDIIGGNKTITQAAQPILTKGTSRIILNNILNLNPRQALLIGCETVLDGTAHPRATATTISVTRATDFEQNDVLFIGRDTTSVNIQPAALAGGSVILQSSDGFLPNDLLTIETNTRIETFQILLLATAIGAYGRADTQFSMTRLDAAGNAIAGGFRRAFATNSIVKIARSFSTTTTGAAVAATIIPVASSTNFKIGHEVIIGTGGTAETVRVTAVNTGPDQLVISRLNAAGNNIAGGLTNIQAAGPVRVAFAQFEGPFIIQSKAASVITLDKPILHANLNARHVTKKDTELCSIIRVTGDGLAGNQIEISPLKNTHAFNINAVEHIREGRVADYSLGFGYGRLDAYEAVRAAKAYDHSERDLVIRNHWTTATDFDDGEAKMNTKEVESPDLWVRNNTQIAPADLPTYAQNAPHQHPQISVDPAIFRGTGRNDMEVVGNYTTAGEATFTIEIDATPGGANPDTFKWKKDNGALSASTPIVAATNIAMSDGVSVKFPVITGHVLGDKWIVNARKLDNRYLYIRSYNRGTLPSFTTSGLGTVANRLNVAEARVLMCLTNGMPVCRFSSTNNVAGNNDMEVTGIYTGAGVAKEKALYTVEITTKAAGGDTFTWWRDGAIKPVKVLAAGSLVHALDDGVQVTFGAHNGHNVGDRWDIYAWNGAANDPFLNLNHYWEKNEVVTHPLNSERAGTREMQMIQPVSARMKAGFTISGLAAATQQINDIVWPEAQRFPTNSPNKVKPTQKLRLFVLGEITPHDGKFDGRVVKKNNNISYRELVFAKFAFTQSNGTEELIGHVDVSNLGLVKTQDFQAEIRSTAGFFETEKLSIKIVAKKVGGAEISADYAYDTATNTWKFIGPSPAAWLVITPPNEAVRADGTQPVATGEQYDVQFQGTLKLDKTFTEVIITSQIGSSYRNLVVAKEKHSISIYPTAPLPTGTNQAKTAALPKPLSHVFADMATLVEAKPYGVINADEFRTTYLFTSASPVQAYAPVDCRVVLQRDPTNNDSINLILKPIKQVLSGFTPILYFVFRGIQLTDYLKGIAGADADNIRPSAGAIQFVQDIWDNFIKFNAGATDVPADVLNYKSTQVTTDKLHNLFLGIGTTKELELATKGTNLGTFFSTGSAEFGLEIVLEEGGIDFDLAYARKKENIIDVSGLPASLDKRIKQEQILSFIDPAAFYGLHLHEGGKVELPGATVLENDAIFTSVIDKFTTTKHCHYLDIRSSNSDSYNFYTNYKDANDKNVQTGFATGVLALGVYEAQTWPLLIINAAGPQNNATNRNDYFLKLRIDDNVLPMLHVEHGFVTAPVPKGKFINKTLLKNGTDKWTHEIQLKIPNTGPDGAKIGIAWISRLYYGRDRSIINFLTIPNTVLSTKEYTDNVFGPIDFVDNTRIWGGAHGLKWATLQDNRYVDATNELSWQQMMKCGVAIQSGTANRILLYAVVTDSFSNGVNSFVPIRGIADGVSSQPSFFSDRALFGVYQLIHDQLSIGGSEVRSLKLATNTTDGYPTTNVVLLGMDKTEFDTLVALNTNGISKDYLRNIRLRNSQTLADTNGINYKKFDLSIQGLKTANAQIEAEDPATTIEAYTVDDHFFFTKNFSNAEALPTAYTRSYEEALGTRQIPATERTIASVVPPNKIVIENYDWTTSVVSQDTIKIDNSASNNLEFTVTAAVFSGGDTTLTLSANVANTAPLGRAHAPTKTLENKMIDIDQQPTVSGTDKMQTLVNSFISDLALIANNGSAKANILAKINSFGPKIYKRAYLMVQANNATAKIYSRALYWARNKMSVAIKEHAFSLASLSGRNELVARLDLHSRGYAVNLSGATGTQHKVLLVAFDPYAIDQNLESSNSSAILALNLHKKTLTNGGKTAYFESIILPMRYSEMDAGKIESLITPFLSGANQAKMIIVLNQSKDPSIKRVHLDRIAARLRSGLPDNNLVTKPAIDVGGEDEAFKPFFETSLPIAAMVPGPFAVPKADTQKVYFDESYGTAAYVLGIHFLSSSLVTDPSNGNAPTYALATLNNGDLSSFSGSGGSYFSNEVFYRIAKLKEGPPISTTITGLITLPQEESSGMSTVDLITTVQTMIESWVITQ